MREGIRVRLLGAFEVEGIDTQRLGSRKARTLLKMLAVARGAPVHLDAIVEALWDVEPPARPGDQVAVLVSRLRSVVGAERLVRSDAGYAFRMDWIDVVAAEELVDEARRRFLQGNPASARAAVEGALTMFRGPLLADEPDAEWISIHRGVAERLVAGARHLGSEVALHSGDAVTAAEFAEDALDRDPYDETALRLALAALSSMGRRASALALYERTRARIDDDLGVDPSDETQAAHVAVLKGLPVAGVVIGVSAPQLAASERGARADAYHLPGRSAELAVIDGALERAREGRMVMVGVEGEAGIGKTRLLDTWAARVSTSGALVLVGRCDELGRALPLQAVLDALSAHLRSLDADEVTALLASDRLLLGPLLDRRAVTTDDAAPVSSLAVIPDPGARQAMLFGALASLLERLAQAAPVALIIDDVHLASAATFEWLQYLQRRQPDARLVVLVSRRPEEGLPVHTPLSITLGPLDLAAVATIVGSDAAATLHARSGGNPLLVVELARGGPSEELPTSLLDAITERCARAGAAAPTLMTAAVLGPEVDLDLLSAVLHAPAATLLDHLEEGVRRHFLAVGESSFVFRHALVREALVAGTTAPRRALVHREAARSLAARSHADPLDIAYHARAGGDEELESTALVSAAVIARQRYDYPEAERLLDRAVGLRATPSSLLDRAIVRVMSGRYAAAGDDASAALAQGAGAPALEVAGFAAYYQRDFVTARRLAEQGLRLSDEAVTRASLLLLGGRERHAVGDLPEAERFMDEAMEVARNSGIDVPSVWRGFLRVHLGRPEETLETVAPTGGEGSLGGHLFASPHVHFTRALAYGALGRCSEAFRSLAALDDAIERQNVTRFLGRGDNTRGWLLRNLGALDAADECNQRGLETARRIEYVEAQAHALLDLAEGRLLAGDLAATRRLLDDVAPLQRLPQAYAWRHVLRRRTMEGRLALAHGAGVDAVTIADEVVEDAEHVGAVKYGMLGRLLGARARAMIDEPVVLESVETVLLSLDRCAGLEAWWLTAEAAQTFAVERWWDLAETRVASLAANAGEHADGLRAHAARQMEALRRTAAVR
ncbi:MAG TPA: BTAD domain-containing putative transcriptional regulator [Candidatus Dormibacteraeota bacterium]|nr:BTAD domain-containing putative transcriptional regulator [Candidatus Dormibacteraeota bacterium]